MEIRSYSNPITFQERAEGEGSDLEIGGLTGYIAMFASDSLDMGGYIEQIRSGAFAESLKSNDVVALVNHHHGTVVGRMSAGTLQLREDATGLKFDLSIPNTQAGRDLKTLVQRGDLQGCSFGFDIRAEDMTWSQRSAGKEKTDICTLERIDLHEVSVGVTFPAYPATSMAVRDAHKARRENLRDRDKAKLEILKNKTRYR